MAKKRAQPPIKSLDNTGDTEISTNGEPNDCQGAIQPKGSARIQRNDNGISGDGQETDSNPRAGEDGSGEPDNTPQVVTAMDAGNAGGDLLPVGSVNLLDPTGQPVILVALTREGEGKAACWERLRKEARAVGMPRGQGPGTAYEWATREADRLFPPKLPPPPEPAPVEPEPAAEEPEPEIIEEVAAQTITAPPPADMGVAGLGEMPPDWPTLPANATLQVEIAWVSANRLRVRSGSGVDLSRALSPAPSYSALSWLETSILFPSKFADISVKATANQDDEKEYVRREKMAIDEVRSILAEMLEDKSAK